MKLYDSYSQETKEFQPTDDNNVKMYVCGPTVYDSPHLGHARCYITWDVVVRYLKFKGYNVTYARNITDVDDKIIKKAQQENKTIQDISDKYYNEFKENMHALNVLDPDIEPKATENIQEMINIINILIEKNYAYAVNGDVYFRVKNFPAYGKLSKQSIKDLESGARIEPSERKENALDFALWKNVKTEDEQGWNSPWGKGRPGWHIECSAMSKNYLDETIDIHAGGQDLLFPHHENELAQSEAAFGKQFVKFWMHNGFVTIDKEKMSKSLGNFITINDLLDKYDANTIRFFILTNHYRMPVEFSDEGLKSAKSGIKRLKNTVNDVKNTVDKEKMSFAQKMTDILVNEMVQKGNLPFYDPAQIEEFEKNMPSAKMETVISDLRCFVNSMDNDFNTSKALACLFEIAGKAQKTKDISKDESACYTALLIKLSEVLGFDLLKEDEISNEVINKIMEAVLATRKYAREQKMWDISDKIRDELKSAGIVIKDNKDGTSSWGYEE
jgi:cysteinyl-tRNA synthetase